MPCFIRRPLNGLVVLGLTGLWACGGPSEAQLAQMVITEATLNTYNERAAKENATTVRAIQAEAQRNRWYRSDSVVYAESKSLHTRTDSLRNYLHDIRRRLLLATGNEYEWKNPDEDEAVTQLMLRQPNRPNLADSLQQQLKSYHQYLHQQLSPSTVTVGAAPAQELRLPRAVRLPVEPLSFGEFYFADAPVAAAALHLAQLEAQVLQRETEAMENLRRKVGSHHHHDFVRIGAYAIPESNQVPAGGTYRARLLLVSAQGNMPGLRMTANGQPVPVQYPLEQGQVSFPVPASQPPGPAVWEGTISTRYYGQDTTFRIRVPYTVVRP
ncbi:hypothetical protein [Hymenobacter sp. B81]|uniref:hypothetical protein n=1 Tax=Hymenobacter sp. B81 TaxID=3344878 RepID=UPI0037DDB2DF